MKMKFETNSKLNEYIISRRVSNHILNNDITDSILEEIKKYGFRKYLIFGSLGSGLSVFATKLGNKIIEKKESGTFYNFNSNEIRKDLINASCENKLDRNNIIKSMNESIENLMDNDVVSIPDLIFGRNYNSIINMFISKYQDLDKKNNSIIITMHDIETVNYCRSLHMKSTYSKYDIYFETFGIDTKRNLNRCIVYKELYECNILDNPVGVVAL